jgi:LAS superfamily LD-carboxypeptidase LdcB
MSHVDYRKNMKLFMPFDGPIHELADFQGVPVHKELIGPLAELSDRAAERGFEFAVASGFRSVERQCHIWNAKVKGERPIFDDFGAILGVANMDRVDLMFAILRWSALPGTSRHHWGTDVDVYDRAALPAGQLLQLTLAECRGPFATFHGWLDSELAQPDASFFRPYVEPYGGVAPEPWHLSYAPLAVEFQRAIDKEQLREFVSQLDIQLKEEVVQHFDEIFSRFIDVPLTRYPPNWSL